MIDIVQKYGLKPNIHGFLNCPFHEKDDTASLKIYKDSFYCFGCHAHGDVITFTMLMENCSFKSAFQILGGDAAPMTDAAANRILKRNRYKQKLDKAQKETRKHSGNLVNCQMSLLEMEPFSDAWCEAQNKIPALERNADSALIKYLDTLSEGKHGY